MAQGITLPLPAFINPDSVEDSITETVESILKRRRINTRTLLPKVKDAIVQTVQEQVQNLLKRDYGIFWDPRTGNQPVLIDIKTKVYDIEESSLLVDEDNPHDFYNLSEEQITLLQDRAVKYIEETVLVGCALVASSVVELQALGFPDQKRMEEKVFGANAA